MNKRDFKKYMQKGHGRCATVLSSSSDIEKYKDVVLWGCLRNLSYDAQCEGTRGKYVYELTTYFNDEDYFLLPCINAYEKISSKADLLFSHLTELLCKFSDNGNKKATKALFEKYDYLFSLLLSKKSFRGYDYDRDNFERICVALSSIGGTKVLSKLAEDMGRLFKENEHYTGSDFDWFFFNLSEEIKEPRLSSFLKKESKRSENAFFFYENYLKSAEKTENVERSVKIPDAQDIKNEVEASGKIAPYLKARFFKNACHSEKLKLAKEAINEDDLDKKAELLSVFAYGSEGFPLLHDKIIEYSKSCNEKLRDTSLNILTSCKSKSVLGYALSLLAENKYKSHSIQMLLSNYTPELKQLLLENLYNMKFDYKDTSDRHSTDLKILESWDNGIALPKEFFIYVYDTTLCSCCRERAVRILSKRRCLTTEIIEECRHDSNYDIVQYINKHYPSA